MLIRQKRLNVKLMLVLAFIAILICSHSGITAEALIESFEGFRARAYPDGPDKLAIGFGHLIRAEDGDLANQKISVERAREILRSDIAIVAPVRSVVTVSLAQNQIDALTSLSYNIGLGAFRGSTLLRLVNQNAGQAVYEHFGHWRLVRGKRSLGLQKRRFAEVFVYADRVLDPNNDAPPSAQWDIPGMTITDQNWAALDSGLRAEAVAIYWAYKGR